MITCHWTHLESKCRQRGYTLDEVMPCVVAKDGDQWTIDVDHSAYPRTPRARLAAAQPPSAGPGTELKSLLAGWPFYITSAPNCSCNAMAAKMDRMGCEWCESADGLSEVLAAMRDNAEKRGLPFIDAAGRMLVRRAVAIARRKESRRVKEHQEQAR